MQVIFGVVCSLLLMVLGVIAERAGLGASLLAVGAGIGFLNLAVWAAPKLTLRLAAVRAHSDARAPE